MMTIATPYYLQIGRSIGRTHVWYSRSRMEGKTLNIFDFDGTLFKSPVPNPSRWDSNLIGKFKSTKEQGGLGWFQDIETLSEPYVPILPGDDWFEPHVRQAVLDSMNDDNSHTVLLTGRTVIYQTLVESFIKHAGLVFDACGFKPSSLDEEHLPTMTFKRDFIKNMIDVYKPGKVRIWEDREDHITKFTKFIQNEYSHLEHQIIHVDPPGETHLSYELEVSLVATLKERSKSLTEWDEQVLFTGVFLDEESVQLLQNYFPPIPGWTQHYHHMTICLGSLTNQNPYLPTVSALGSRVELQVTGFGKDDRAYAVEVKGYPTLNQRPHVTLCIAPGATPKESNLIREWNTISTTIELKGKVEERKKFITKKIPKENNKQQKLNLGRLIVENSTKKRKSCIRGGKTSHKMDDPTKYSRYTLIHKPRG